MAIVVVIIAVGILIAIAASLITWRCLRANNVAAADVEAFLVPSSRTVRVASRPPPSLGRPTVPRSDLVRGGGRRLPRAWHWTSGGASPAATGSWNARQWYSPDAEARLEVPPGPPGLWNWKSCGGGSASNASRSQNWYRPSYHSASAAVPNFYYSPQVTDPHVRPTIPSFYVSRDDV